MTTSWYDDEEPESTAGERLADRLHDELERYEQPRSGEIHARSRRENMRQTHALRRRRGW